ncbi:M10 family metallopeptidase C-terminal domain-containing protein [Microvirga lenta]|uniref:M10 family metallopeptidase C-terminal domain-containing protein n=1 Tax=Microvirga lenta TaxID=2881337 RepID=UPI001CFFBCF7|nr:M10 family metallopeptidase C-terminal domain-containing protein [Microvirga lenta]MCB5175506.1 M10 family metallopeptidase C-terminal domain-containing protein [Microvirga lenta]
MPAVVTYSPTGNAYIDGVLGDRKWAVNSFTFSFPTNASFYGSPYSSSGEPTSGFEAFNPTQQAATREALKLYASVANLSFTEIAETATQHADLRFAMSDKPGTAWAYFPSTHATGGDAWFNNSSGQYDNPRLGNYAYLTVVHEIGHALGLEHAHEEFVMPQERDSMEYTVMSYRSYVGASTTSGYVNEGWGYAQSLMMYDIAALQHMYGANYSTNSGNTTYSWSPTTGEMSVNGTGQGAPGGNRIFQTVWDGGGTDTYDFSQYSGALKVDLQPGGWTTTSTTQLAKLHYNGSKIAAGNIANALLYKGDGRSLIENAIGGSGSDTLIGNQAANVLKGGSGADSLTGGIGNDTLDGGAGIDTAVYGGQRSQYAVQKLSDGSLEIADLRGGSPDGRDIVWNIEWIQFVDRIYSAAELTPTTTVPVTTTTDPVVTPTTTDTVVTTVSDTTVTTTTAPTPLTPPIVTLQDISISGDSAGNRLYGAGGNDSLYGLGGNDVLHGAAGADRLSGGTGKDTASYSGAGGGLVADLLYPSRNTGDAQGDIYVSIENLTGSAHADSLRGSKGSNVIRGGAGNDTLIGRAGNDTLDGGSGDDVLQGQTGRDVLVGRGGRDKFVFKSVSESRGSSTDVIKDFTRGSDKIDLRAIDANSTKGGNQAFSFIGKSAFTGKAGELRFYDGKLSADINGDTIIDFQVKVSGLTKLSKGDFYL